MNLKSIYRQLALVITLCIQSFISSGQTNWQFGGNTSSNPNGYEQFGLSTGLDIHFITNNMFRMNLTQTGALGLGIQQPRGWHELQYCPPTGQPENGMIVTLNYCNGNPNIQGTSLPDVIGDGNVYTGEGTADFTVPFSFLTGNTTTLTNPLMNPAKAPIFWVRAQSNNGFWSTAPGNRFDTKFIVMPDGSCGVNVAQPRAALDVRGSNSINYPAAIFGSRAVSTSSLNANGLVQYYTQQIHFVPVLGANGYNQIVEANDQGMFFSDGKGTDGANLGSALVIAPWASGGNSDVGGMRMDKDGNTEFHGTLKATKVKVEAKWWSDFVFEDCYRLKPLNEVEDFIKQYGHLPEMPNENNVIAEGIDVSNMLAKQQQKIEELTLYIIQQQKQINELIDQSKSSKQH